jgi:Carboxypeptidase regulatory-like domain
MSRRGTIAWAAAAAVLVVAGGLWWLLREEPAGRSAAVNRMAAVPAAERAAPPESPPISAAIAPLTADAVVSVTPSAAVAGVRFTLPSGERGQRITGLVVDEDLRPVPGARVQLVELPAPARFQQVFDHAFAGADFDEVAACTTGADGRFELLAAESRARPRRHALPGKKGGQLRAPMLRAEAAGLIPVAQLLALGGQDELDAGTVVLARGGGVQGRVVDSAGRPVSDATVRVANWTASRPGRENEHKLTTQPLTLSTQPDGRFEASGLLGGRTGIEIERPGWAVLRPAELSIQPGAVQDLGTLVLADGERLAGFVTDTDDRPMPGVEIVLLLQEFLSRTLAARTRTDEQGRFELQGLMPAVQQQLAAVAPGGASLTVEVNIPSEAPVVVRLDLRAGVQLTVLAPDGQPQPTGMVRAYRKERLAGETPVQAGAAFVPGDTRAVLVVQAADRALWAEAPPLEATVTRVAQLQSPSVVRGVARDAQGRGLPGLLVRAEARFAPLDGLDFTLTDITEDEGRFELPGLCAGAWSLQAERDGLVASRRLVELQVGERLQADLVLATGGRIQGRVVTTRGAVVPGIIVRAGPITAPGPYAATDAEGRFALAGLTPGLTWVSLPDGTGSRQVVVSDGDVAQTELVIPSPAHVSGRVHADGRPLAGLIVRASHGDAFITGPYRAVTDADGLFDLGEVKSGELRLGVSDAHGQALRGEDFVLGDGEQRHVEFELVGTTLRVHVRAAEDGRLLPDAELRYGERPNFNSRARAAEEPGVFVFEHVDEPSLWLQAKAPGRLPAELTASLPPPGSELTIPIDLQPAGRIQGTVLLADGGPMLKLSASWAEPAQPERQRHASVERDGGFLIDAVTPGRWEVTVSQWLREGSESVQRVLATATLDVQAGETARHTFTVQPVRR